MISALSSAAAARSYSSVTCEWRILTVGWVENSVMSEEVRSQTSKAEPSLTGTSSLQEFPRLTVGSPSVTIATGIPTAAGSNSFLKVLNATPQIGMTEMCSSDRSQDSLLASAGM